MNSTERLVEAYYRQKGHFTLTDVKVQNGNNRQFDILSYDSNSREFFHIEISVTHSLNWATNLSLITNEMRFKFFGIPKNKRPNNPKTDFNKGKTYVNAIKSTYSKYGINFETVNRVWCTWNLSQEEIEKIESWKNSMKEEFKIEPNKFHILLFRDEVLQTLINKIGTSNYDDEILRTLSLISEYKKQRNE
jgi:hypothetical protein